MNAVKLFDTLSMQELLNLQEKICNDPANKNPPGSFYLHTKAARRKLDAVSRAITWHLEQQRADAGNPVLHVGYSGLHRKRKRRR